MSTEASAQPLPPLPLTHAAAITAGVVVAIAGFVALGAALHVNALYAGFLLLWVWSTIDELALKALPAALLGALTGSALSYLLQTGTATGSAPLVLLALGLMIVALFFVVARRAALICNPSTMLFVTVLNAPVLQAGEDFRAVIAAIALGAVWFGAIAWLIARLVARQNAGTAASAAGHG